MKKNQLKYRLKTQVKNRVIYSLSVFLAALISLLLLAFFGREAGAAGTVNGYLKFPGFDPSAETGTIENPFIILEIVPYRGMGQIGYLIGGQEPVDISLSTYVNPLWGPVDSIARGAFQVVRKTSLESTDHPAEWTYRSELGCYVPSNQWKFKNKEIFKRQILHLSEEQLDSYHIRVVTVTPEELNLNVAQFTKYYDLQDSGRYHKLPGGANEQGEIDLIANADLISISPKAQAGTNTVINLWESYGRDTSGKSTSADRYYRSFQENDLNWQTALELFMKIGVVEDRAALIYDITCITSPAGTPVSVRGPVCSETCNGYVNNVYKLLLMLRQSDPLEFYNLYLNTNNGTEAPRIEAGNVSGKATGVYADSSLSLNSRQYWGEYTFLPFYPDGTKPAYLSQEAYKSYINCREFLVSWIAGNCHDSVIRNCYSYNGTSNIVQYFTESRSILDNTYTPYDYNSEFFGYLEESLDSRPADATPLQAVEYLMNYRPRRYLVPKEIRILELQPCKDFSLTVQKIRQLLPGLSGSIRLEQQTTAEFIGRQEDLNSTYDFLYIGTNTGTMKTDLSDKTLFNDPALDGLVYLHVGDRIAAYDNLKGAIRESGSIVKAIDYLKFSTDAAVNRLKLLKGFSTATMFQKADLYRFSGNDITAVKRQQLEEYVEAGYPVLLEKSLFECDRTIVDDSSNLYAFLNDNRGSVCLYNMNDLTELPTYLTARERLSEKLSEEKLSITMLSAPCEYDELEPSTRITGRTLQFQFLINAPTGAVAGSRYDWSLSVDRNADGRYIPDEVIANGQESAGNNVTITRALDEKYADAIPWKLKVCQSDDNAIRAEECGFAAFTSAPLSEEEAIRTQIEVLQITSNNSTVNLEALMNPPAGKTSLFYQYTKDLEDFNVRIKTITVNQLQNLYTGSGSAYDCNRPEETDKLNYIDENGTRKPYDMLILGFGDCYSDIHNNYGALDNIRAFINSGRSVLFTHDTTSFVNLQQSDYEPLRQGLTFWGYGINRYFRNRLGLDRFGILRPEGDMSSYDRASMPSQAKNIYKAGNLTNGATTYPEAQGLTYPVLVAYSNPGSSGSGYNPIADALYSANKDYPPFNTAGNQIVKGSVINQYKTNYVTKVNEGQITSYPYDIPDRFRIGESHAQYYQLNLDDPEVMVWFCLSDASADETGPYSTSPNDTRNNYYIYSKGNVMYTVVGHSAIDAVVEEGTVSPYDGYEVKLFINTMIASYQAGVTAPEIRITNQDAVLNNAGEYVLYENPDQPAGTVKRIWFKVVDTNLTTNRLVTRIYYKDAAGTPILADPEVYLEEDGSTAPTYQEAGKEDGYQVIPGKRYYFDLTLEELTAFRNEGKDYFLLTVTNENYQLRQEKKANLVGRVLFDLD